jgi:hypothetical protein
MVAAERYLLNMGSSSPGSLRRVHLSCTPYIRFFSGDRDRGGENLGSPVVSNHTDDQVVEGSVGDGRLELLAGDVVLLVGVHDGLHDGSLALSLGTGHLVEL